jgi:hypothetical protein
VARRQMGREAGRGLNKTKKPTVLPLSASVLAVIDRRWHLRLVAGKDGPKVCDLVVHRDGQPLRTSGGASD